MRTFIVCTILVFCFLALSCSGWIFRIPTGNMIPTIQIGDSVIINKYAYYSEKVERFDIVAFKAPEERRKSLKDENLTYLKRIIGLPNEKIEIKKIKSLSMIDY